MDKKVDLLKEIDEFVDKIGVGCEGTIGILKLERNLLIQKVKQLEEENNKLIKQLGNNYGKNR